MPNANHDDDDDIESLQVPPNEVTNHQLYVMLVRMSARQAAQNVSIRQLRQEVKDQADSIEDMTETWESARGVLRFIKVMGAVAAAGTALLLLWSKLRGH